MITLRLAAAAFVAGAATLLSSGAAQAEEYPDATIVITIPDSVIYGGDTFDYTAEAEVDCSWTVTYGQAVNGSTQQTAAGTTSISGTFDTKRVDATYKSKLTATCTPTNGVAPDATPPAVKAPVTSNNAVSASAVVTLLPRGAAAAADTNGALPDTGGSNLWILVAGGGLVLVGGGLTYAARRRTSAR